SKAARTYVAVVDDALAHESAGTVSRVVATVLRSRRWLLACRSWAPPASSLTPRSAWASPRAASSPGPCPAPSPFLGGRSREEIETLLTAHHLANVTSDPLLDFVAAQEARMSRRGKGTDEAPPLRRLGRRSGLTRAHARSFHAHA